MQFREKLGHFLEKKVVQNSIILLIIINALLLGLETASQLSHLRPAFQFIDTIILGSFVVELAARLYVHRVQFFKDVWSLFDFVIVLIALLPSTGSLSVLRALRVLRAFRLLSAVPSMRKVIGALVSAIPGLGSIALVLMIVFYVFAVIGTNLFGQTFPLWFGSIGESFYTLFQIMTLESWSMGIARPVMEVYSYAWAFFVPFILVATFTMLNLFIAIIVNAMQTFAETEHEEISQEMNEAREQIEHSVHTELKVLQDEIRELKALIKDNGQNPAKAGHF